MILIKVLKKIGPKYSIIFSKMAIYWIYQDYSTVGNHGVRKNCICNSLIPLKMWWEDGWKNIKMKEKVIGVGKRHVLRIRMGRFWLMICTKQWKSKNSMIASSQEWMKKIGKKKLRRVDGNFLTCLINLELKILLDTPKIVISATSTLVDKTAHFHSQINWPFSTCYIKLELKIM